MRQLCRLVCILLVLIFPSEVLANGLPEEDLDAEQAMIIEVEGNPHDHKKYLNIYHPNVEVISIYDTLFNGLAIKANPRILSRLSSLEFIKAVHTSVTYKINTSKTDMAPVLSADDIQDSGDMVIPEALNDTEFTGKGVKVAVIDTGVDYTHPDLEGNYRGGYDLVDLDENPMETLPEQGMPTQHGTHVAGIIAGNGTLTGVAPDAEIYAYRALGPGGIGSSVQIIAAMEQAVKDGVDIINLSLGNNINGPDYPTSIAVNKATELGIAVVTANGNSGPDDWTVGSPATAPKALSIGAAEQPKQIPYLYDPTHDKTLTLTPSAGSVPWQLSKDYAVTTEEAKARGKIFLVRRGEIPFYEMAKQAENQGAEAVLIYNNGEENFQGSIVNESAPVTIPVAHLTKEEGEWLEAQSKQRTVYLDTAYADKPHGVAEFSSRGPVTVNWDIKPDLIAPGTDILSTVPEGYQVLQGTSMAAPHVAGVMALLKEAKPDWSNDQMIGALKTTAEPVTDQEGIPLEPIVQGTGAIQPEKAIETSTIIDDPALSFGKNTKTDRKKTTEITIENTSDKPQSYTFNIPKKSTGLTWNLPKTFTLDIQERKTIPIDIDVNPYLMEEGVHQGWLTLEDAEQTYQLPYLFINETADHPKAMGFGFALKQLEQDIFQYQIYLAEKAKSVDVHLYHPDTLVYERQLLNIEQPEIGLNEGEITREDLGAPGIYKALIKIELENGSYENDETMVVIDP